MHRSPWTLVTALGFALVALLLVAPTLGVFQSSFYDASGERLSLGNYAELFGNGYYREALLNSVLVSLAGTLGACLLGVPLALLTTRFAIPGKRLLKTLAVLSLLSPPFIGAYAWILILGNNGFLRHWLSALGIDAPTIYGPLGIALVFAIGLLASGLASTSVGSYAGATIMAGLLHRQIPLFARRVITIIPAVVILALGVDPTWALVLSQVFLSFGIPFALIPLLRLTSDRSIMGASANSRVVRWILATIVVLVVVLNLALIVLTITG